MMRIRSEDTNSRDDGDTAEVNEYLARWEHIHVNEPLDVAEVRFVLSTLVSLDLVDHNVLGRMLCHLKHKFGDEWGLDGLLHFAYADYRELPKAASTLVDAAIACGLRPTHVYNEELFCRLKAVDLALLLKFLNLGYRPDKRSHMSKSGILCMTSGKKLTCSNLLHLGLEKKAYL